MRLQDCDFHQSLELYRFVSAMALLSCGSIYFLGGVLCFGLIKRSECLRMFASSALWQHQQTSVLECSGGDVCMPNCHTASPFSSCTGRSNRERKRQQAQKDLEELETKRSALRGLLGRSD